MASHLQSEYPRTLESSERRNRLVGMALIAVGALFLLGQVLGAEIFGSLFLLAIAAVFVVAGIVTRKAGLFVPGGILAGIGMGVFFITLPFLPLRGDAEGGVFMLCFALGWGLITVLTALFTDRPHLWPLIPGAIMAFIGAGLLMGSALHALFVVTGGAWPVILIALGAYMLFVRQRNQA